GVRPCGPRPPCSPLPCGGWGPLRRSWASAPSGDLPRSKEVELRRGEAAPQLEPGVHVIQVGRHLGGPGNVHSPAYADNSGKKLRAPVRVKRMVLIRPSSSTAKTSAWASWIHQLPSTKTRWSSPAQPSPFTTTGLAWPSAQNWVLGKAWQRT